MKNQRTFRRLTVGGMLFLQLSLCLLPSAAPAADSPGVVDKAEETVKDATAAVSGAAKDAGDSVVDASRAVGDKVEDLWRRVDEARLKNRTPDEIVAWLIMGVLVGGVAGMMTSFKPSGLGQVGRLLLGLAGAFLGGITVHLTRADFGWGPVLIRYEELLFALVGAIGLVMAGRLIRSRARKQPGK